MDLTKWDSEISTETLHLWKSFQSNDVHIIEIRIPRWNNVSPEVDVKFHGFPTLRSQYSRLMV